MYVIWLHRIILGLCVPVDPPDTELDCVGVNGEGSYYTAVVGGVSNVVDYVTAEPNVPECASAAVRVIFKLRWSTNIALRLLGLIIHLIHLHTSSSCKFS